MLLSLASEVAIRIEYKDQDKMFYVLNKLADAIEALLIRLGEQTTLDTNDMFIAVEELRALLFSSLIQKGAGLKRTVDYEVPNGVITTLNVAYDLYKDIDREEEIYDRNEKIARHPGFLPSGDIMKVLES
jgi:prophage DNA circulation protein